MKIPLTELEPKFVRYETKRELRAFVQGDPATWQERGYPSEVREVDGEYKIPVATLAEAQGVIFLCPLCKQHMCEATFAERGVLPHQGTQKPGGEPVRWEVSGTGYEDLTTKPSIQLIGGCEWHGHITDGQVT